MSYQFSEQRYQKMRYRYCGRSGLQLPEISLGAWETFGGYRGPEVAQQCIFRAFDLGITHFDLANTYGSPFGNAELVCGRVFKQMPRDELIISTKAGWTMWPGPYGDWGSRKSILASVDQSLKRLGLEYVDIFYSHRPDANTPLDETLGALDQIIRSGKALYAGISAYNGALTAEAVRVCQNERFMRLLIHQPQYNMLLRTIEWDLLPVTQRSGMGVIVYCPLASGLLTDKYLDGTIPENSRAAQKWGKEWIERALTPAKRKQISALNELARSRGQTLAQMALAWILRLPGITSALIGASSVKQVEENVAALEKTAFTTEELSRIDALTMGQ